MNESYAIVNDSNNIKKVSPFEISQYWRTSTIAYISQKGYQEEKTTLHEKSMHSANPWLVKMETSYCMVKFLAKL